MPDNKENMAEDSHASTKRGMIFPFVRASTHCTKAWLLSFLLACLYLMILYIGLGQPCYETNDDVLMAMTVAGVGFSETPDPHIIYTNFLIGLALINLYKWTASVPWYGIYLVGTQVFSLTIILRILSKKFSTKPGIIILILSLISCLRSVMFIQFTTTASLLAISGALMLLYSIEHRKLKSIANPYFLGSIFVFTYASLIRWQSVLLILILTTIILSLQTLRRFDWDRLQMGVAAILVTSVSMFSFNYANSLYYEKDPAWQNLYPHCKASWQLINSDRLTAPDKKTRQSLKEVGWTPVDIDMFYTWYFLEPQFSDKILNKLDKNLPKLNPYYSVPFFLDKGRKIITDPSLTPVLAIIVLCIFFLLSSRLPSTMALSIVGGTIAIIVALMFLIKCPPRVYASILQFTALILLLYSSPQALKTLIKGKQTSFLLGILMAVVIGYSLNWYQNIYQIVGNLRVSLKQFTRELASHNNTLYVVWSGRFPYEAVGVLESLHSYFGEVKFLGFNSLLDSPIFYKRLNEFAIKDFVNEMDNANVMIIAGETTKNCVTDYMIERHQRRPIFTPAIYNDKLRLSAARVEYTNDLRRPNTDQSKTCPVLGKEDLILFDGNKQMQAVNVTLQDMQLNSKQSNASRQSAYTVTGFQPRLTIDIKNQPIKASQYSHFFVEVAVPRSIFHNRQIWLLAEDNRGVKHTYLSRLLQDDKIHLYAFPISELHLSADAEFTKIIANPLFTRTVYDGEKMQIGRIGLIQKRGPGTPE